MTESENYVESAQSYINNAIATIKSPRDVAGAVGVSYETLRKRFRREVGMPLGRYIQQARIDRARRLLLKTAEPVYVICWRVGFSSDSSGIRAFKRVTGMTMGEYRERYKNSAGAG